MRIPRLELVVATIFACVLAGAVRAEEAAADQEQPAPEENPWKVNPFQKTKYVQAYPPEKFGYLIQAGKVVYRGTYDYEASVDGKTMAKQTGNDLIVDFIFRNNKKIPLPTGNKHGVGTIRAQLEILGQDPGKNREEIARLKNVLKILEKDQRKVSVFDGYRYQQRRPTACYNLRDPKGENLAPKFDQTAMLGYTHTMQEFQIDESGKLTEDGGRMVARDDKEDMSKDAGNIYLWWGRAFNHWEDFPEFPMLPPDIDYIRARNLFVVQNIMADWEVSYREAKRQKTVSLIDDFCKRWFGKPIQEVLPGLPNYTWREVKPIANEMGKNIEREDNRHREWLRGEWKDKYLANEDLYANRPGSRHKESEAIALIKPGVLSFQHNECEFVGREGVEIVGLDNKKTKFDCLHFRREVKIENLMLPFLQMKVDKWRDDIWFEPRLRLVVKREFDLDFSVDFIQQIVDPKNPKAPPTTKTEACLCRYRTTLEMVQRTTTQRETKTPELMAFKNIVNSFNSAVGADYSSVKAKLDTFQTTYAKDAKADFATPAGILTQQCANIIKIYTPEKGFRRHAEIYPDEYFCSYVPEDFNSAKRYGLIVFLADEDDDLDARIKEWGQMLIGKQFIAIGYRPQGGKYNHTFGQSADHLYNIIRAIGSTYNIDPKRRYMVGAGKGAQMVLSMAAYSFSDFDRFALFMPITGGYLPFDDDCRSMINGPQGQACQQALTASSFLYIYPGEPNLVPTGLAPDSCMNLTGIFKNIHAQNKEFDNYVGNVGQPEEKGYSKEIAKFILNKIIPGFESGKQKFFESLGEGVVRFSPPAPAPPAPAPPAK